MLEKGKIIDGRYRILEKIGSGGFGAVYLAEDTRFSGNNRVAVKQIAVNNETVAKTSKIEADLLYNLSHPNLPKVTNCFEENGANFIVMDYISGEDLAQGILKKNKLCIEQILLIADQVLDALEYLHSFPIYHRDIKPHNIKVDDKGRIFLLDFGTAKGNADESQTLQFNAQSITGYTPFYAPLEQVLRVDPNSYLLLNSLNPEKLQDFAERKTDGRSDVYGLGATLYHLLTGFSPEQATATIRAHALWSNKPDPLPFIQTLNSQVSNSLANAIHRALETMPENRFQTAKEFRQSLKNLHTDSIPTRPTEFIPLKNNFEPAPTQFGPQIIEIAQTSEPANDFQPSSQISQPSANGGGKMKIGLFAAAALLLFGLIGLAGGSIWYLTKDEAKTEPIESVGANIGANQNSNSSNQNNSAKPASENNPTDKKRTLEYSLLVQKMRDGKKFQEPFESSGQEIFENGYQFEMAFTPSNNGFLYIFAEGFNEKKEKVFNIIFPTPLRNNGQPDVVAAKQYRTGWNEFSGTPGTENFWVILSHEKPPEAENARENAFKNSGTVTDSILSAKLKEFLEKGRTQKSAFKDSEKKLSRLELDGDSVIYLLQLEHR